MIGSLLLYFLIFLIVFVLSKMATKNIIYEDNVKKYTRKFYFYYIFAAIVLILFSGLRYKVGTDFDGYVNIFKNVSRMDADEIFNSRVEFGFLFLNKFISLISKNPSFMMIISSSIIVSFTFMAIKKLTVSEKNIPYAILIFMLTLYPQSFNMVRQGMAVAIVFYAYSFIIERNLKKYILWILIAGTFHSSALICLPLYLLYGDNKIKITIFSVLFLALISFLCMNTDLLLSFFNKYEFLNKYSSYISNTSSGFIGYTKFIKDFVVTIILLFYGKRFVFQNKTNLFYVFMVLYSVILELFASSFTYYNRILYFFSICYCIFVPNASLIAKFNKKNVLLPILICCFIFSFILDYYVYGFSEIFPYRSVIFGG